MGTMVHAVEGEMLVASTNSKVRLRCRRAALTAQVPYFNAPICARSHAAARLSGAVLENKSSVGKVDEILGPINEVYFTVKVRWDSVRPGAERTDGRGHGRQLVLERR